MADGGCCRARIASGLTLLRSDEEMWATRDWSYVALADVLGRVSERPEEDRVELFRRMAFNALVSNLDDHPRNHAIISRAGNRGWRLSRAYDVTPTPAISEDRRDLAMACGAEGRRASAGNLLSECGRFGIGPRRGSGNPRQDGGDHPARMAPGDGGERRDRRGLRPGGESIRVFGVPVLSQKFRQLD